MPQLRNTLESQCYEYATASDEYDDEPMSDSLSDPDYSDGYDDATDWENE